MSNKRWTLKDDIFLCRHHQMGADFIASHDLGHHGKNAGEKRISRLKEAGIWEKIEAYLRAETIMCCSRTLEFSTSAEDREIAARELAGIGEPLPAWELATRRVVAA